MPDELNRPERHAIPPSADPAETMERLLSRRQLKIESGDVLLARIHGSGSIRRESYELRTSGDGGPPERFATFEHAAARGELLATQRQVRLFFIESRDQAPFLLKDARRA